MTYNTPTSVQFFETTYLLANISMKVILEMFFLSFDNIDVKFTKLKKLTCRFYTAIKALFTTSQIKFMNKKNFAKVVLNTNLKTFVIHVSAS